MVEQLDISIDYILANLELAGNINAYNLVNVQKKAYNDKKNYISFLNSLKELNASITGVVETDPIFTASVASSITSTDIINWNDAFSWGDHSLVGYLTSYTETDPIFTASAASSILSSDITNWNTAFGWGNHATAGYITGTGSSGKVAFWTGTGVLSNNTNLHWDNVNGRLGVGTSTPSSLLHVNGALTASSATLGYNSTFGNGVTLGVQGVNASSISLTNFNNYSGTGNYIWVNITGGQFAPTSGSGQHAALGVSQTINQTGTANGQVSGIAIAPTLTSVNGSVFYRGLHLNIPGTNHYGIYQSGTNSRNYFQGSIGINATEPHTSSILDIVSTTKGVLLPRMLSTERNAIASPATSLLVYQTDSTENLYIKKSTAWKRILTEDDSFSLSLGLIGSTPNANAATISSGVLNLEPASASFGGIVTTGNQIFAGAKTFSDGAIIPNQRVLEFATTTGNVAGAFSTRVVLDKTAGLETAEIQSNHQFGVALKIPVGQSIVFHEGSSYVGSPNIARFSTAEVSFTAPLGGNISGFKNISTGPSNSLIVGTNGSAATSYGIGAEKWAGTTYAMTLFAEDAGVIKYKFDGSVWAAGHSANANWTKNGLRLFGSTQGASNNLNPSSVAFAVVSSTQGSIPAPVMTTAQRDGILSPATGLLIYNITTLALEHYNGTTWSSIGGSGSETDPVFTASDAFGITSTDITNWNNAYSWGDHSLAGYLTSFTESDPVFSASPAFGITSTNITNWNSAYSWGNHASAGYLTSFTETDPTVAAYIKAITNTEITNWNTAFGWGNHSSAGYLTSATAATTYVSLTGSYSNPSWITSLDWSKLTSVPSTFTPSSHTHSLSDITQSGATIGQVPQWNGSAWTPSTVSSGSDLLTKSLGELEYFNDFTSLPTATTSDGNGLAVNAVGSGTGVGTSATTAANRPGIIQLQTGTTATGRTSLYNNSSFNTFALGGGAAILVTDVIVPVLSDGTNRFAFLFGFYDATTMNQTDGIYFLYDEGGVSTGSTASANWQCVTVSNGNRTFSTTSVPVSNSTFQRLAIEVNADGTSVTFKIDGVSVVPPHTTNIPTGVARIMAYGYQLIKSLGTTSRTVRTDFFYSKITFTTSR